MWWCIGTNRNRLTRKQKKKKKTVTENRKKKNKKKKKSLCFSALKKKNRTSNETASTKSLVRADRQRPDLVLVLGGVRLSAAGSEAAMDALRLSGMYDATSFHVFTSGVSQSPSAFTGTSSTRWPVDVDDDDDD
jgi:hypothetical protein